MRPHAALVTVLLALGASRVRADATDGLFALASEHPSAVPSALAVATSRGTTYVVPGARLASPEVSVGAQDNANTSFSLDVRFAHPPGVTAGGQCPRVLFRLGAEAMLSSGWGGDAHSCSTNFVLDAPTATRAARALGVARLDRQPIGERVTGTFSTPRARYRVGEPIEIVLHLDNPAAALPVAWVRGGRNRGPRDDQFDFTITRDGLQLARTAAHNFGGMSQMDPLGPGEHDEARTLLAPWADLGQPGRYEVRCSFVTVFSPEGVAPHDTTRGHAPAWDRTFTGTVRFEIVP